MNKAYKATNNMKCIDFRYEVDKTYSINSMKICDHGFHYCINPKNTLNYYSYNKDFMLLEIEVLGKVITEHDKSVTDKFKVLRVIPKEEYKKLLDIEYDDKGNMIYQKDSYGKEYHWKYDDKGNRIYYKDSNGNEYHWKYDEKGNKIYEKNSYGREYHWKYEYDDKGNLIYKKDSNGKEWKITIE